MKDKQPFRHQCSKCFSIYTYAKNYYKHIWKDHGENVPYIMIDEDGEPLYAE